MIIYLNVTGSCFCFHYKSPLFPPESCLSLDTSCSQKLSCSQRAKIQAQGFFSGYHTLAVKTILHSTHKHELYHTRTILQPQTCFYFLSSNFTNLVNF